MYGEARRVVDILEWYTWEDHMRTVWASAPDGSLWFRPSGYEWVAAGTSR